MAWNGSGTYNKGNLGTGGWVGDAAANIPIQASRHDTQDNDFATGINNCLAKDGQNAMTGDLNMGLQKIKNLALGTAAAPAIYPDADTNTGIFSPGADSLAISTGGTERFRVNTTDIAVNNLKITGVATPTNSSDVATKGYVDSATLADGDKGDITVSASGATWTIDNNAITTAKILNSNVTYAKIQDVSATDRLLGRSTAGAGVVEEITCTAAGRALLDDVDAAAQRTTLGAAATSHTHSGNDITSGTIATARLGSGTANNTTFLRGDQTWQSVGTKNYSIGLTWQFFNIQASTSWQKVAYSPSLDRFCVVSIDGTNRIATSTDCRTWTLRTAAAANEWRGIAWSPSLSLFAAVSSTGTNRVQTSPDGITWTSRSITANDWQDIAWSPSLGLFAAVSNTGTGNRVATSTDGITWTTQTSAADNSWRRIIWSSNLSLFIAVSNSGTTTDIMTSSNGTTWTTRTTPAVTSGLFDITYSANLGGAIATCRGANNNITWLSSTDGLTWTQRTPDTGIGSINGNSFACAATVNNGILISVTDTANTFRRLVIAADLQYGSSHLIARDVAMNGMFYSSERDLIICTGSNIIGVSGL